jgi:ATP-dependent DNA helicase RecQ
VNSLNNKLTIHEVLKTVFGFDAFRPNQEFIIRSILNRQDVFAVMPTGGGKSLCFQLPALMMQGTAVIISPLISLMKDQVDAALENGIPAAFMNSSLGADEVSDVYRQLKYGKIKLLYIAPERFAMQHFLETLKNTNVSLFAIDEAHCISEWGHDFRPDYLSLSGIPKIFPDIPIAAFTATATQKVQADIISKLGLRSPRIVRASFNRPNLFYQAERKSNARRQILELIRERPGQSGIVYRTTRDSVMDTAAFLVSNGIKALPYHAGLSTEKRAKNQDAFNMDEASVIVATIAFGMGIDKSNVRFIIHADLPKNIESYYQETGRAGRDGEPAHCVLLFSRGDIPKIRYFIDQLADEDERSIALEKLTQMAGFAEHNVCRRKQLLGFFGEDYLSDNCGACDICSGRVEQVDITADSQMIMSAISRTQQAFGALYIIDIVTGADTERIRNFRHNEIKIYGAGKGKDKKHWRFIVNELLAQGVLRQDGDRYPILKLTEKGTGILFGNEQVSALKREESIKSGRQQLKEKESEEYDDALFERLRAIRKAFADEQQVPPFVIFSDKTLFEMCRHYPVSSADMMKISGVGSVKLERYGEYFISAIKSYLDDNPDIAGAEKGTAAESTINSPSNSKSFRDTLVNRGKGVFNAKISETVEKTYELYKKGFSLQEMSKQRGLAASTITSHLEKLIHGGYHVDICRFVDRLKMQQIEEAFRSLQNWNLGPVIERFSGTVSYEEARLVRACIVQNKASETYK